MACTLAKLLILLSQNVNSHNEYEKPVPIYFTKNTVVLREERSIIVHG